jgi:two-component sensor histidine kinase
MSARTLAALHDVLTADSKTEGEGDSISVYALLDKVLTMLQRVAAPKRIRTALADFQVPPRSGAALALVVNELVNNAVKHGKDAVSVALTLNGDMAALEVTDNGPGFSADFDPIVRANTGLELVENLVTRDLGGRAAFDNLSDGGCRVIIRFPISKSAESPVNTPPV